ncbi:MAG: endonuclease III [Candidatus Bathyarchaeota archaeon]
MPDIRRILQTLKEAYPYTDPEPSTDDPFKTLISCILSQRTRDSNSEKATDSLFNAASTPEEILRLSRDELEELIKSSGFYRQKAQHIAETCRGLVETHGGAVPGHRESLLRLPGVGPKTADIVLSHSFNVRTVPVDVHVWRVTRRLGLAPMDADHEEVKRVLEGIVPDDDKLLYDRATLRIGKEHCRKTGPRCGPCPLAPHCGYKASRELSVP